MPHSDDWQHQQELQPVRHRIQHEHGGAEYRNRADGRHDKTGDEGANFRFRSARFARITEPDVWTAPFCAHCTPVSAEPDAWAPSAVARMSESPESDILAPTEPTAEPAAAPTLACFPGSTRNMPCSMFIPHAKGYSPGWSDEASAWSCGRRATQDRPRNRRTRHATSIRRLPCDRRSAATARRLRLR